MARWTRGFISSTTSRATRKASRGGRARLSEPIGSRERGPGEQLPNLEGAVGIALLGLVVIAVALHAVGARADLLLVTLAARADRREQDVLRLRAGRRLVALGAGDRPVDAVVEARVRKPAQRNRR